tara:strand:+ start:588 stop:1181 length:594 start_codon:yes stop_codon:yes gene_type:complete
MKKSDIVIGLVVGEITAWYFFILLRKVEAVSSFLWTLPIIFPILTVICLWIAFLIGKRFLFIFQLAKFLLVGVLATIVDLGILGLSVMITGITGGVGYAVMKGVSFIVATVAKYSGDKIWAFEQKDTSETGKEFSKFFLVTLIGLVINITIASLVVDYVGPQFGLSDELWANVGGIAAAFGTVLWNFLGYKFLVFKK